MKERSKNLLRLFLTFAKIGAFTFGGGYAMIPLIQKEMVEKNQWITDEDMLDIIAISESTPGPIAINAATFVGHKVCGFWGAFSATLGITLPSFLIIYAISFILRRFNELKIVKYAFNGIRAGVLALILKALVTMYKKCKKNLFAYIVAATAFVAVAFLKINTISVILACAVAGLAFSLLAERRAKK